MAEIALGWLGWTEEQALKTDVNAIVIAYEGRVAMLKACFGSSEDDPAAQTAPASPPVSKQPISPQLFDSLFGGQR